MALIPYRSLFDRFLEDEGIFLPAVPGGEMRPSMNIYEKGNAVIAELGIPGIDPDRIEVSVEHGILSVRGSSEETKEEKERGYWRKEIRKGSFERMVRLPVAVKEDKVEASCKDGILTIVMPKTTPAEKKPIRVKASKAAPKKVPLKTRKA